MKTLLSFFQSQSAYKNVLGALPGINKSIVGLILIIVFWTSTIGGVVMFFFDMNTFMSLFLLGLVCFSGWLINRRGYPKISAVILITALLIAIQYNIFAGFGIHDVAIVAWPAYIFFTGLLFGWQIIPYVTALIMLLAIVTKMVPNAQFFTNYSDTGDLIVMLLILLAFSLCAIFILRSNEHLLKRSQQSDERFQSIYNAINDAIIIQDSQTGAILNINEKMSELFGYTAAEITLLDIQALSADTPLFAEENTLEWIKNAVAKGPQQFEWLVKDKKERLFWVDVDMKMASIAGQKQILITVRDISKRKEVEDALEESREKFYGLSEASFEAIFISEKGICVEQNRMAERMFGYSDSEAIGKPGTDWIVPEDRATVMNNMLSGHELPYEVTAIRKDGSRFPAIINGKMMHYKGKNVRVTSMSDITARKKAEDDLKESENLLRRAQEIAQIGHFKFDPGAGVIDGSEELFRIFGLSQNQIQFSNFVNSVHPEDRAADLAFIETCIANKTTYEHEHRLLMPDGKLKWICMIGTFPTPSPKESVQVVGTVQDITERKRAEMQREVLYQVHKDVNNLLDSDKVLNSAVETITRLTGYPHVCVAFPDESGLHWVVRGAAGKLASTLGTCYPIYEGVIGRTFRTGKIQWVRDIINDPDYLREVGEADMPLLRSEIVAPIRRGKQLLGALNIESDLVDIFNEADTKMFQSVADMIALALENTRLYDEAQQEITIRKKAEDALHKSNQLLEMTFASLQDAVFIIDANTSKITDCNPAAMQIFGYGRKDILDHTTEFLHVDNAALDIFRKNLFPAVAKKGFLYMADFKMKRMDGSIFPTEHTVMPLKDEYEKQIGWVSVVRDITSRKLSEAALRESEEHLREAQRIAQIGNWELELENNYLTWSDEVYRIFEIDPGKTGTSYTDFLEFIHPADIELVDRAYTVSLETRNPFEIDLRLLFPDGHIKYVHARSENLFGSDGKPLRSVGTVQDITDRKLADEALLGLKRSIDQAIGGIARADMNGTIVFANKAWARMHDLGMDEIIGKPLSIFHTQEQMVNEVIPFNEKLKKIGANSAEIRHVRKGGTSFVTWMESTVVKDNQQQPIELIASAIDITERKLAEQALHENEENYRRVFDNASLGIFQATLEGQIISINTTFAKMLGYDSPEDAKNNIKNVASDLFADPNRRAEIIRLMAENPDLKSFENTYRRKDGSTFIGQLNVTPVRDTAGRLLRTEGMIEDITERKQTEAKMRAALEEKETLLREVHHRVKNNLQAMIALMEMQSGLIPDENTKQFLKELEGQARTMALVYEQLYQSVNLSRVHMATYLQQLTFYISETFGNRQMIELELKIESIELDVSQAMPCGLIVNELFTNIHKHAFPPGFQGKPQVKIGLKLEGEFFQLTVADNGIGIPPAYDRQTGGSLGMRLVNLWATHQLGGTLNIINGHGAAFIINFPNTAGGKT